MSRVLVMFCICILMFKVCPEYNVSLPDRAKLGSMHWRDFIKVEGVQPLPCKLRRDSVSADFLVPVLDLLDKACLAKTLTAFGKTFVEARAG